MTIRSTFALAAVLFAVTGCDSTSPKTLEQFDWVAVENPSEAQPQVDAASFFGDVNFLGQFQTPNLCFNLVPSFTKSGSTLTLRVDAKSTHSSNCLQSPGGFRYTGVLRHLDPGTYTFHMIHAVEGSPPEEFTVSVTI